MSGLCLFEDSKGILREGCDREILREIMKIVSEEFHKV